MCLPVNFAKFLRTLFYNEHLRWLLLSFTPCCHLVLQYIISSPREISSPLRLRAISFKPLFSAHRDSVSRCTNIANFKKAIWIIMFKGATKFCFTHYSCAVITLFNTGLYKSTFSTCFLENQLFCLSALFVFTSSVLKI